MEKAAGKRTELAFATSRRTSKLRGSAPIPDRVCELGPQGVGV